MIIRIKDINDKRLDVFYRTNDKSLHYDTSCEYGLFMAESELVIKRALDKQYEPVSFLISEEEYESYSELINRCNDVDVYLVGKEIFDSLKGSVLIKGILGCFKRKDNTDIKNLLSNSKRVVVLENVENPTNVGAIFRNAAALFCDAVLVTDDSCDPLYKRSIRVSMGNVFNVNWAYVSKNGYFDALKEYDYKTVSFALRKDSVAIDDEKLKKEEKLAIILGSEGYGLKEETIEKSDYVVKIDMSENVDSLNVASASGIALYELCRNNKRK